MKIRFFTRSNNQNQNIFVRVYHSKDFDYTMKTGIVVSKDDFSNAYQKVKNKPNIRNKDVINKKLDDLKTFLLETYNDTIIGDNNFHKDWLKERVYQFFNKVPSDELYKKYLVEWANYYKENEKFNKKTGLPLSNGTLKKYTTSYNVLIAFEKFKGTKTLLKSIDYSFYKNFVDFCLNEEKYTRNTTGAHIKTLKLWIKESNKRGFSNVDLDSFISMTNQTIDTYLTTEEIYKIYKYDFSDSPKLSNVRDLLIVAVYTGLRISDFMRLRIENISGGYIEITTEKTKNNIVIPVHPYIKEIIQRNNGHLPRTISDQRFNEYVKDVCEAAEINQVIEGSKMNKSTNRKEYGSFEKYKLVSSHIGRRSFATNLYGKIDNLTIMAITGHKTEKEFLKYIKITPKQHAEKLNTLWKIEELNNENNGQ